MWLVMQKHTRVSRLLSSVPAAGLPADLVGEVSGVTRSAKTHT